MTNIPDTQTTECVPTYLGRGDPTGRFADYHPTWMGSLASDGTPYAEHNLAGEA